MVLGKENSRHLSQRRSKAFIYKALRSFITACVPKCVPIWYGILYSDMVKEHL